MITDTRLIIICRQNKNGIEQEVGSIYNWDTTTEVFVDYCHQLNKNYQPPQLLTIASMKENKKC